MRFALLLLTAWQNNFTHTPSILFLQFHFFPVHVCPLLLLKKSFSRLRSSLKCSRLQSPFTITHYTCLLLLTQNDFKALLFLWFSSDLPLPLLSLWVKSILHPKHTLQFREITEFFKCSTSVREWSCWSKAKAICVCYKYSFLSFFWQGKNLCRIGQTVLNELFTWWT